MSDYVICCPNCDASMTAGSACPECEHVEDDPTCTCDHCLMCYDPGDEEEPDDELDLDVEDEE